MNPTGEIEVRRGTEDDLEALNELYNHYVVSSAVTFDVEQITREQREVWFRAFDTHGPHQLFVATRETELVGFACSKSFRQKAAYATSVETTIYLAPGEGGGGTGSRLYGALFEALASEDVHRAYAGITLPNDASVALHTRFTFRDVGTYAEVGRKFGRYHSVRWMEKAL